MGGGHTTLRPLRTEVKTCIIVFRFAVSTTRRSRISDFGLSKESITLTYIIPRNDLEHNPLSREEYKFLEKWAIQRGDAVGQLVFRLIGENQWHEQRFYKLGMLDLDMLYDFIRFLEEERGIGWD